jgi:DNA-binding transcriptional LysR family regulator
MAITITQLSAFLAVVRGGSVTAAAERLVVTQPSVSAAVSALGREVGCPLFERVGRGIRPTAAGEAFAPYAADVLSLLEQGRERAREAGRRSAHRLCIASVTTAAESFLPVLLHAFAVRHPQIEVRLDVGNHGHVLTALVDHRADVVITGRPPVDPQFVAEPLLDNEMVCITETDHWPGSRPAVLTAALADRVWLLREVGSGTRELSERFLADRGLHPVTQTLGSNGAIVQAVRAGLGVSLVSRLVVEDALAAGLVGQAPLLDGPCRGTWFLLRSAAEPQPAAAQLFVEFLRARLDVCSV